ncbi:MAG: FAD-dependent oxidoreductase [Dehalococcoidia bacterium]|nr:FAD-dependent oxidoreductase [Dehalococcoidia bacterium]
MEHYRYIVVGNSAGAIAAARELRKVDDSGSCLMLSEEPHAAYSRPLIAKHVSNGKDIEAMRLVPQDFYSSCGIDLRLSMRAASLDTAAHTLMLGDGSVVGWDRLLLATGSTPIIPPVPGNSRSGVHTFTTYDDAKAVALHLPAVRHAVVVGGGFIGLSAADALLKRGIAVTIVEMQPRILSQMLDAAASRIVEAAATTAGAVVMTGRRVNSIDGEQGPGRAVTSVVLDDGTRIPCEMVILAVGVRSRTELAAGGISVGRGIIVDEQMRTSRPDVFACGDACQSQDFVRGVSSVTAVWPNAVTGGAVAGANMAGLSRAYKGGTTLNALPYFGLSITSAGVVEDDSATTDIVMASGGGSYRKVILRNGVVIGMVFAGDTSRCGLIHMLMKRKVRVDAFKETLVSDDLGLLSLPATLWEQQVTDCAVAGSRTRQDDASRGGPAGAAPACEVI